jgi:hypothetical protein
MLQLPDDLKIKERTLDVGSGKAQYQGWGTSLRAGAQL